MAAYKITAEVAESYLSGLVDRISEDVLDHIDAAGLVEEIFEDVPKEDVERVRFLIHDRVAKEFHRLCLMRQTGS